MNCRVQAKLQSVTSFPRIRNLTHVHELSWKHLRYIEQAVIAPHTFEQLRTASVGHILGPLTKMLSDRCHHPHIVSALMIAKWQFGSGEQDDRGINEARGFSCEIVAWRFLAHFPQTELIDYLLHQIPSRPVPDSTGIDLESEASRHLSDYSSLINTREGTEDAEDDLAPFKGLNALEIASIANAKKFLSQRVVQKVVDDIWNGQIIFWESLNVHSKKKAKIYNKKQADPYCRLRVPKYQKGFEAIFFTLFLVLYYAVLVERNPRKITIVEVLLYIWIAAFAYDEFGEFRDAGTSFYATDFWSLWDIGIIGIGFGYMISSESYSST